MDGRRIYDIAPIQTNYHLTDFRSKLEARWAVFFDRLGWNWQYEPKKFKLKSFSYIPDFYFPDIDCYAEVKPLELNSLERKKCIELSILLKDTPILPLIGVPDFNVIKSIQNGGNSFEVVPVALWDKFYPFFYTDSFDKDYFNDTTAAVHCASDVVFCKNHYLYGI